MKTCIFILPYFGRFNSYFSLFLKSCKSNSNYNWLIITDDHSDYDYPTNVQVVYLSFEETVRLFKKSIDESISLETPYKLCDFKPTYGLVFQEYIKGYDYWGYCDCDVLFGNLDKLLTPILEKEYDKIFSAGHLTIYKNTKENNTRFMKKYKGRYLYRDCLTSSEICWFDEDYKEDNIHSLFIMDNAKVYSDSLAFNPSGKYAFFRNRVYDPETRKYKDEDYHKAFYAWNFGEIIRMYERQRYLIVEEFLYIHLQHRKMDMEEGCISSNIIQIVPNRFIPRLSIPDTIQELQKYRLEPICAYKHIMNNCLKKLKRKMKI